MPPVRQHTSATCVQRKQRPLTNGIETVYVPGTSTLPESAPAGFAGFASDCFGGGVSGDEMCLRTASRIAPPGSGIGTTFHFGMNRGGGDPTFGGWLPSRPLPACSGGTDRALCAFDNTVGYANSLFTRKGSDVPLASRVDATARCCAGQSADCFPDACAADTPAGASGLCWTPGQVPQWLLGRAEPRAFAEAYCAELGPGGVPAKPTGRAPFGANPTGDPTGGALCEGLRALGGGAPYRRAMLDACFTGAAPDPWFGNPAESSCAAFCGESHDCRSLLRPHCATGGGHEQAAECACLRSPGHYDALRAAVLENYALVGPFAGPVLADRRSACTDARCASLPGAVRDPDQDAAGPCPPFSMGECVTYDASGTGIAPVAVRPECLLANGGPYEPRAAPDPDPDPDPEPTPDPECVHASDCPDPPEGQEARCANGRCVNVPKQGGNGCGTGEQCAAGTVCFEQKCRAPCAANGACPTAPQGKVNRCERGHCFLEDAPPVDDGLSTKAVVGIVCGAVVLIALLAAGAVGMGRRRRRLG